VGAEGGVEGVAEGWRRWGRWCHTANSTHLLQHTRPTNSHQPRPPDHPTRTAQLHPQPGRKPASQLSERELLQRHEANERRRLKGLRKKREREEAIKERIRKATSAKFRRQQQRGQEAVEEEEEEEEGEEVGWV